MLAAACAAAFCAFASPAPAAGGEPPLFFDTREAPAKPDLSGLTRLRFLTTTDFPPFNFIDGNGRLAGFHVELARAICAELALQEKCEIQALPWAELQPALARGDGDAVIAGMAVNASTRAQFAFSRSYLQFPARFAVAKGRPAAPDAAAALAGRKVGVVAGSAHQKMLTAYFPRIEATPYPSQDAMVADLKSGRLDAVFGDGMRLALWLATPAQGNCCAFAGGPYLAPEFLGTGLAIAVKPESTGLAEALDYGLQRVSADGTFAELYLRYFPVGFF